MAVHAGRTRVRAHLHHTGIGETLVRTHIILLVDDLHIHVVAATGELLRELTPTPRGLPPETPKAPHDEGHEPDESSGPFRSPVRSHRAPAGIERVCRGFS